MRHTRLQTKGLPNMKRTIVDIAFDISLVVIFLSIAFRTLLWAVTP